MASRRLLNLKTASHNRVHLGFSFPSGAAEDGTFTDQSLLDDGYVADGYGAGDKGLIRGDVGSYKLFLDDVYAELEAGHVSIELSSEKAAWGVLVFPAMSTETGTDQKKRSVVQIRIVDASGGSIDLAYNDRIHIMLDLKNSNASP